MSSSRRSETEVDGLDYTDGFASRGSMVSSDPRLTGTFTYTGNWLFDPARATSDHNSTMIRTGTYELTNDGGSWIRRDHGLRRHRCRRRVPTSSTVFEGHGGYEGLTAVAIASHWDWRGEYVGTIFPAAMPENPEPYAAE